MIRRGWPTAVHLGLAALLALVVWQSSVHLAPAEAGLTPRIGMAHGDRVLGPWLYWDAQAYADISANGYTAADRATFEQGGEARVAFCWSRYGDPFAFSTAQRGWGSPRGVGTWIKRPLIDMVLHLPDPWFVMRLVLQGFVGLAFLLAIPAVWRRVGPAYGVYTLVVVALPMIGASAFQSMGRQMLAAFPVFALLGDELATRSRRSSRVYLGGSALVLLAWASFWGRGYWMG